jgi:hypothetical protein
LPASGVSVTDVLPAGYAFVSASASQGSTSGTTTVTWSVGSLASGAAASLQIVATVMAAGPYANTGAVVSLLADPAPANNISTATAMPVATVNAVNDSSVTASNTPVTTDVLANDTGDRPLDPASVTVTVASPSGTTSVNAATGAITFTPNAGFGGTASYTYRVCDTSSPTPVCDAAVVTVQVASPPLMTSSANPSVFGQPVTFTATVTGNAPTGILVFRDGATTLCSATASTSGNTATATCTTSNLSVGTHPITAAYSGDANNAAAASAVLNQTVNRASTTTTVTPPAAITLGQSATITATVAAVAPGAGTPTGTVTISDGSVSCTAPLSGGNAGCALTPTAAGTQTVTATYSGDTSFATSSGRASLLVNAPPTATPRPTPIPPPTSVPALDRWALLLLAVLTALLAAWRLRRSSR